MIPVSGVPPATPLTLQETPVSVVPVTAGINVCVVPKSSEADRGVTLTLSEVGVGVGGGSWTTGELVTRLLQAKPHAVLRSRARVSTLGKRQCGTLRERVPASWERGRIAGRNAGEGPVKASCARRGPFAGGHKR